MNGAAPPVAAVAGCVRTAPATTQTAASTVTPTSSSETHPRIHPAERGSPTDVAFDWRCSRQAGRGLAPRRNRKGPATAGGSLPEPDAVCGSALGLRLLLQAVALHRAIAARLVVEATALANDLARVAVTVVGAHRHERAAFAELVVVVLRLVLGDAEAHQRASDPTSDAAGHRARRRARESACEKAAGDHRADARDQERRAGADDPAEHDTRARAGRGHLTGLVAFLVGLTLVVAPRVSDLVVLEAFFPKIASRELRVVTFVENTDVMLALGGVLRCMGHASFLLYLVRST